MASGGVSVNIISNVRPAVAGIDDVADAVEEAADRLNDLTKEGDTAGDRLERDFRDISRAADRSSDELRAKFKAAYRDVARASDDSADDAIRAQRRLGEQSEEVGQEIRQNLGEGLANAARGDFEALSDTIGDTLGGAAAGIGGFGFAAAGAAAALGVGAIVAAFQLANEERQKLEDRAQSLAGAYIEAGSNVLDAITVAARTSEILTTKETREEAQKLATALGVDLATAARAYAGDASAVALANNIMAESQDEWKQLATESADYMNSDLSEAEGNRLKQLTDQLAEVRKLNEINGIANDTFRAQQEVLKGLIEDADGATQQVDDLGNSVYTLPDGTQIFIDAETGQASTDISNFKGDLDEIPSEVASTLRIRVDDSAARGALDALQRRANRGIDIAFNRTGAMTWE